MTTTYKILNDNFKDKGPFTGQQIDDMIKSGEIDKNQDVQKTNNQKIIKAYAALLSAQANDAPPSPPSAGKAIIGAIMVIIGIATTLYLLNVADDQHHVKFKHFIIPGVLFLVGAKFITSFLFRKSQTNLMRNESEKDSL